MRVSRWVCLAIAIAAAAAGCSWTLAVTPGSERVEVLRDPPTGPRRFLGRVSCERARRSRSLWLNVSDCRTILRNQAARLGADFVVLFIEQTGGRCLTCAYFVADAYERVPRPRPRGRRPRSGDLLGDPLALDH